ncbi:metalloreductase STEAP2 [Cololabis saira]|uniref:metalloreductase STEAP2 n=1 Tax=Cololabis saira TaxID=129043 RepID=UPI002AD4E17D|nr:metalloreductase STEAP2 [Cololabis saira]XP_061569451.1 metalloreductase STEAP2 [Cololabis saira]
MDSISLMGRSPVFLTSSSQHQNQNQNQNLNLDQTRNQDLVQTRNQDLVQTQTCSRNQDLVQTQTCSRTQDPVPVPARPPVAVLGSGDFSRSLALRLLRCGFSVVVGSRRPQLAASGFPHVVDVTRHQDAVAKANVVFLGIRREHYGFLWDLRHLLAGKILVDVSNNRRVNQNSDSNAEFLASLLPESIVVKGFNVISAWTLQQTSPQDASRQVFVCSDSVPARQQIMDLARQLHFQPVDLGLLSSSRELENLPVRLFPGWRFPVLLAVSVSTFFFCYSFTRDVLHPYVTQRRSVFYKIPLELVNRTLAGAAATLLALVYLAGQLAAGYQLARRTKYRRFPRWLEAWLAARKPLGLLAFFLAAVHVLYSLCLPMRRSERFLLLNGAVRQVHADVENSWNEEEVWRVEMYVSFGVMSFGLLALLAVTSISSVSSALNWREFSFIQSSLGYVSLVLVLLHGLLYGWRRVLEGTQYRFFLPPSFVVALVLPGLVVLGKLLLLLPPLKSRLTRLRRGLDLDPDRDRDRGRGRRLEPVGSAAGASPERITVM